MANRPSRAANNPLKDALTPQEMCFARLRAQGLPPVDAYREAFNKTRLKRENCTEQAYRIQRKPQVATMVKTLLDSAEKSQILTYGRWLSMMVDAFHDSLEEGNRTAAASFGRLMGQGIGALQEKLAISDERLTEEQLLERLGSNDPVLAERVHRLVNAKRSFDA